MTDYILSENLRAAYAAGLAGEAQPYGPSGEDLASLWSSDSLITSNLEAIYGAALQVQKAAPASQAELTPEVKQALADEVKTQIADKAAAEKSQDSAGKGDELPAALDPKHRIFVVASTITVTATEDGSECQWTQGDIIERASGTADSDNNVEMIAKSTRKEDCSRNAHVSVPANELQEMHNHFRETLQTGMKSLADNSGKDGLQSARHCHSGR